MKLLINILIFVETTLAFFSYNKKYSIIQKTSSHILFANNINKVKGTKYEKILNSVDYIRDKVVPETKIIDDELYPFVETIVKAADKRKASSLSAHRITHLTEVTQFMILVEGRSAPQNQALSLSIEDDIFDTFSQRPSKQGTAASGWIVLDYGSVLVHIMTPQMRGFYKLEKKWKEGEEVDLTGLLTVSSGSEEEEDDEFGGSKNPTDDEEFWS